VLKNFSRHGQLTPFCGDRPIGFSPFRMSPHILRRTEFLSRLPRPAALQYKGPLTSFREYHTQRSVVSPLLVADRVDGISLRSGGALQPSFSLPRVL